MERKPPHTLRDYYEEMRTRRGLGRPRYERLYALRFEGKPLGDHRDDIDMNREDVKRFLEMQGVAWCLIGCDADLEIDDVEFQDPPSADCRAYLKSGSVVSIEVSRIAIEREMQYKATIESIARTSNELLAREASSESISGEFFFWFYGGIPLPRQAEDISEELVRFSVEVVAGKEPSTNYLEAGPEYPTLHELGVHVARDKAEGPARLLTRLSRGLDFRSTTIDKFRAILDQKKRRFHAYADGNPVWLAMYVDTPTTYPYGTVDELRHVDSVDPAPFERVLVGTFTVGVTFAEANKPPIYTSMSENDLAR